MSVTDPDGKPGLRIETAVGVIARDTVSQYFKQFGLAIRRDRLAGRAAVAAYIDGLAGACSLVIAGGHGSKTDVVEMTIKNLRDAIDRDLKHLKHT